MTEIIWLLLLVPLAASLGSQLLVRSTYRRYSAVPNHVGLAGAEIARALLDAHGLQRVRIRSAPGSLSDNYDGERKRLALSRAVATERTVSAMGIAAHEVAHAYQDADGDRAYRARRTIAQPLTRLAPWFGIALIGGYWFGIEELVVLTLIYAAGLVLFAVACTRGRPRGDDDEDGRDRGPSTCGCSAPSRAGRDHPMHVMTVHPLPPQADHVTR